MVQNLRSALKTHNALRIKKFLRFLQFLEGTVVDVEGRAVDRWDEGFGS